MTEDIFYQLASLDNRVWSSFLLKADLLYDRIPSNERIIIIEKAVEYGKAKAALWLNKYKGKKFEAQLKKTGVTIVENKKHQKPPVILLAFYESKAKQIEIFTDAVALVCSTMPKKMNETYGMQLTNPDVIREIVLAHECFHMLDFRDEKKPSRYSISYKIGPLKRTASIHKFDEIAATTFVEEVCGLQFNPTILNVALMESYDSKNTVRFIEHLEMIQKELKVP